LFDRLIFVLYAGVPIYILNRENPMPTSRPRTDVENPYSIAAVLTIGVLWIASLAAVAARTQEPGSPKFHINSQRLQGTLEKLSEFGRNPEGGVTRIGFSETDMAAREYVISLMEQAGLSVRVDPAGNIFGRREGSEKLPILLFGSHIDSVLHGGNYDGDVGSMGAIEVMHALNDGSVKTRHPLEAVIWTNEEGNHFGVKRSGCSALLN
jgi:N-carbamoyl-L-amino-acid hydrolase